MNLSKKKTYNPLFFSKESNEPLFFSSKEKKNIEQDESKKKKISSDLSTPYSKLHEIKLVNIGLASPEKIKKWAEKKLPNGKILGQVTNANTLHHKTFKPLKGGLFCERIFGPTKDFECSCGKTKKFTSSILAPLKEEIIYRENFQEKKTQNNENFEKNLGFSFSEFEGQIEKKTERKFCPICDVEYTWSVIRRYQLGFLQLVTPVTHLWYLKGSPSYLSLLLDMKKKNLESVVYCSESMTLETINSMIFPKEFPLLFSFFLEQKKEQNKFQGDETFLKSTSSLYRSWEKTVKNLKSKQPSKSSEFLSHSVKKDMKISSIFIFSKEKRKKEKYNGKNFQPQRLSDWRNLNFQTFDFLFENFLLVKKKHRYGPTSISINILLKLKNFKQTFNISMCFLTNLKNFPIVFSFGKKEKTGKKSLKIAQKKAHQIILKIQSEFLKKNVKKSLNFHEKKNCSNIDSIDLKQNLLLEKKEILKNSSIISDFPFFLEKKKNSQEKQEKFLFEKKTAFLKEKKEEEKRKFHKNSLYLIKELTTSNKENESQYRKFLKKSGLGNFFVKKMIKSILMFRIQKEIVNSEFNKIFFSSFWSLKKEKEIKNFSFFSALKKNDQKILKITQLNTLNFILEKIQDISSFFSKKKEKLKKKNSEKQVIRAGETKNKEFFVSRIPNLINKSKKAQNYSIYCLSHRFCWENEKDWSNFVYFFSAPSKFDDVPIFTYKKRIPDIFHRPFSGAKVIQKLLTEFHFQEFKKMDRQNRILLYELNKQIQKDFSKFQLNFQQKDGKSIGLEKKQWKKLCQKRDQLIRRTKFIRKLFRKNSQPESMILSVLPVLPPDLRPILKIQDQIAASDLNRLYQRVIYRNERLKKFLKDSAMSHSYEMKYAQRLLQEAVDNLLQNGKAGGTPERDSRGRLLKSLSEILKGKQGRFRQHLLGKRVDYSGRSVIVVGPQLKIHECGLPKEMALELFLPFLLKRLIHSKMARTVIGAKTILKNHPTFTWEILHEVMQNTPVLLNRAPTLHRLGIQAFQPKLVEGRAILLHPLVCPAFNADFDGDQMAVHIPLTVEARTEAWKLMCSRNHFFSPATGDPLLLPSQDMVLGCYYLTTEKNELKHEPKNFSAFFSLKKKQIFQKDIHQILWVKWDGSLESTDDPEQPLEMRIDSFGYWNEIFSKSQYHFDPKGVTVSQFLRTTTGRLFFHEILFSISENKNV